MKIIKNIALIFFIIINCFFITLNEARADSGWCCPEWAKKEGYHDNYANCGKEIDSRENCCKAIYGWHVKIVVAPFLIPAPVPWYGVKDRLAVAKVPCDQASAYPKRLIEPRDDYALSQERLTALNPLAMFGSNPVLHDEGRLRPAGFFNRALYFLFPLAGLILFLMLVWGGFEMLVGAAKKQNLDAGKQRVTAAITGFILLFISYWLVQIIEFITGVSILG